MVVNISNVLKENKNIIFSKDQNLKLLREGKLSEIFLADNFPSKTLFENIAKMTDTKVNILKQKNDEIGALCKKPYAISIIGLKKK
jgi:ribosomal protein L30E